MDYDFGIRTDMGGNVGSGHFYRCLAVAKELRNNRKSVVFLVKNRSDLLIHLRDKIPFIVLNGKSEADYLKQCIKLSNRIKVFIFDLPHDNELYGKQFKNFNKTAIIDDLGNKKVYSELLFNGSIVKQFHKYRVENVNSKIFTSPKYIILRNEFFQNRDKIKISKKPLKKILLTFCRNDDKDLTRKILKHLLNNIFFFTIVLGPTYNKNKQLLNFSKTHKNIEIKTSIADMAGLISKQDIVFSSPGITTYELACLGIPSIFIPFNEPQYLLAKEMSKLGFGINFGYWNDNFKKLDVAISRISDYKEKKKIHFAGRKIVDGKGLFRVSKKLISLLKSSKSKMP